MQQKQKMAMPMLNNTSIERASSDAPIFTLQDVGMTFGNVKALSGVNLSIQPGECIGLVGHNGAGKSTLVNIINARLTPTTGTISYNNITKENLASKVQAKLAGIRCVFQELSLCPNLTVLENLRIPFQEMKNRSWRKQSTILVTEALNSIFPGHGISPKATVGYLSIAERQMVEIAIAFSERDISPSLVILDEPTSSLDARIAQQLLDYIGRFCKKGGAVILISHMMGEIFEAASRIALMKDGQVTQVKPTSYFTRESLVDAMGHIIEEKDTQLREARTIGEEILRTPDDLNVRKNEIVGLAGLAGHGQAEALAQIYMSQSSLWRGQKNPKVAFVAGDRTRDGVMPLWSITQNISLATLAEFGSKGFVNRVSEKSIAQDWLKRLKIRTQDLSNSIMSLSGGNQQKVLFAKALASSAPIILMDDPMRGVDIGTKKEVYEMIQQEALNGRTFIWYSTETDEICQCDRVFVFRDGAISAELIGDDINEENILRSSFEMQEEK